MKKAKTITLKAHLWLCFCSFAVAMVVILWVLQILFLGAFFSTMKLNEMKNVGKLIEEQYDLDNGNFYEFWFEHSFQSGMFATLVTESGQTVRNYNAFTDIKSPEDEVARRGFDVGRRFGNGGYIGTQNFQEFIDKVTKSDGSVAYVDSDNSHGPSFAVYGSLLGTTGGERVYLFLTSPIERTDATRKVLETQLIIVTGISVLLALILAYFIAMRLSKPIENTTKRARKLATGDYSVRFQENAYKEIGELSEVLDHATLELSKTEELRRELISNVSHDLRTPLTIIKSYAELIRDISGSNEEKRIKHTNVIVEEANNLSLLVNDMLDLSKIQSGTVSMDMSTFDLYQLTLSVVRRFEYFSENYGIIFDVSKPEKTCMVTGDSGRIEQVIYNLVANAVNYTGDDNRVSILLSEEENFVKLSVCDTGSGMTEEELSCVWDKYYTSREKHRSETAGSGIGLSIVKNILLAHNSPYGVFSDADSGTQFWFSLRKAD